MSWQRTRPVNRIVLTGQPDETIGKVGGTVTEMKPGRLVTKGTNDDDIIINSTTTTPTGWLSYEATHNDSKPTDPDTAYVAGDWATVINGPMVLRGYTLWCRRWPAKEVLSRRDQDNGGTLRKEDSRVRDGL